MTAKRVLVLGGSSAIAQAYARRKAEAGSRIFLVGRDNAKLETVSADLKARGAEAVSSANADFSTDAPEAALSAMEAFFGFPDETLIAFGVLGDQAIAMGDAAAARAILESNFNAPALWLLSLVARRPEGQKTTLVAIGSVAGDRGRRTNFVYGAAKGGLDVFVGGLRHHFAGSGVTVTLVKPGFVDTPMTAHLPKGGPLWASPDKVAADIEKAAARGQGVVYTPWFWRWIMLIIRLLPAPLFNRMKF